MSKDWILKETEASYKVAFVSTDNLFKIFWEKQRNQAKLDKTKKTLISVFEYILIASAETVLEFPSISL